MRFALLILMAMQACVLKAQTLGGGTVYQFLKLPAAPLLSASGGVNVSYAPDDIGLAQNNPALHNERLHAQMGLSFNSYFAGANAYHIAGAYHAAAWQTTLGGSVFFLDYGTIPQADAAGNVAGSFRARDYMLQVSAARKYLERWHYGANLKIIRSEYGAYRSSGVALDVGVLYRDTSNLFAASFLAKNMGVQLSTFNGQHEDLPFDLQIGVTKKLLQAPLGFSVTAQQVHRYVLLYDDTTFTTGGAVAGSNSLFHKLFLHLVVGAHLYLGDHLEVVAGYNRLRRAELNLGSTGNGLNGFSAGFFARFRQFHLHYSRAYFQRSSAYNHFGVALKLSEFGAFGSL